MARNELRKTPQNVEAEISVLGCGFLDRTDSFILTIPIMYYFCKCFVFQTEWIHTLTHFVKGLF